MKSKPNLFASASISLAAFVVLAMVQSVQATTFTWTQSLAATQTWTTAANWSGSSVFADGTANELKFFSDITTALANGTNAITTSVPTTGTMNILTLNGKGAAATGASVITIGTNATTWTLDGTAPTVNLNGVNGAQALNYTIATNLTLAQATTAFTGDGTAGFNFTGIISGSGNAITKSGASILTLSGANTYSGGTTLSAGKIVVGFSDSALGTGALTVSGNASLNTALGGGVRNLANAISINSGTTLSLDSGWADLTLSGNLSGAGNIAQASVGNVYFSGTNTNTGKIAVGDGSHVDVFQFAKTASLYNSSAGSWTASNILVKSNGALVLNVGGTNEFTTGNVTSVLTNLGGANGTSTTGFASGSFIGFDTTNASGGTFTVADTIANSTGTGGGAVGVKKLGPNTLVLSGPNTYTGATAISAGTLQNGSASVFTNKSALSMSGTGTFDLGGFDASVTNVSASVAGNTIINNGSLDATLTISAQATQITALIKDGTTKKLAVNISNANSSVVDSFAPGTTQNTFSGGLTLSNNATGTRLRISNLVTTTGSAGAITSSPFGRGAITIGQANTDKAMILLDTTANITLANDIIVNTALGTDAPGAIRADKTGTILSGQITANLANAKVIVAAAGGVTVTGKVTGSNGLEVGASTYTGTVSASAANDYTGATPINYGTLSLTGASGAIASSSGVTIGNTGTLKLDNLLTANNTNRLKDTGTVTMNGGTLNFSNNAGALNYSETTGVLTIAAGANNITASQAAIGQTSVLTFASLAQTGGAVDFTGTSMGVDNRNAIKFTTAPTLSNGIIAGLVTYGASAGWAAYDATNGVGAATYTDIAALGSTIADGSTTNVRIASAGTSANIALGSATTSVNTLLQGFTTAATVDTAGKTLRTSGIMSGAGQQALTIGAAVGDGTLTALTAGSSLSIINKSANAVTINAPIADYSASGLNVSGSVTLNGVNTYTGPTVIGGGTLTLGSAFNQTLAGVISGSGGLTKSGAGTLILSNANTYTGATTLSVGTLQLRNAGAVASSAVTMSSGSTLQLRADGDTTFSPASIAVAGSSAVNYNYNVDAITGGTTGKTLTLANVATQWGPASTTDTFNVTGGTGSGYTLAMGSGASGTGGLQIWNNTTVNSNTAGVTLKIAGGIAVNYNGSYTLGLVGAGNVTVGPLVNNQTSGGQKNLTTTFGGSGTIQLDGANNFGAATGTISTTGTLKLNNAAALTGLSTLTISGAATIDNITGTSITLANPAQNWNSNFTFGGTSALNLGTGAVTMNAARQVTVNGTGALTVGGAISGSGFDLTKAGTGTMIVSGANTYTGATNVNAGTLRLGGVGALGNGTLNTSGVTVGGSGILDLGGIATTATVPLTLNSSAVGFDVGCFYNTGASVTFGGTVMLNANARIGAGNIVLNNTITGNSKNLLRDGVGTLELSNSGTVALAALQANRGTIQVDAGTTLNVTGIGIGTGSGVGSGLILNGGTVTSSSATAATFASSANAGTSGTLTLNSGTLTVFGLAKGGTAVATFNATFNGGTLKATADNAAYFTGANNAKVQSGGALIDDGGFAITVGQALIEDTSSTGGGLTKSGSGNLTLSGTNTYKGSTTIAGGTLAIASTGSIAASSQIILGATTTLDVSAVSGFTVGALNAQTLSGTGTVNGDITIGGSGTFVIGNTPGTMTFNNNLALTSISNFEINGFDAGQYDLAVGRAGSQAVSFGGTLNLMFASGFNTNGSVKIFDFETYTGTFTTVNPVNLATGFTASFDPATGYVTVVPEPAAGLLGGLGLLALLRRRRVA